MLNFLPDPDRFVSLSVEVDLGLEVDDLRFFTSGIDFSEDSFCFLAVGGLWTFVASTVLFLRFLLVAVVEDPVRSPVTGSRFSLAAMAGALLLYCDSDSGKSATLAALGLVISGWGLSKKTVKLRADMLSN